MTNASSPDNDGIFIYGMLTTETHTRGNFTSLGLTENEIIPPGIVQQGSAAFHGTGSLSVIAGRGPLSISAQFNGAGSMSIIGGHGLFASAIFNGTGNLNVNPTPVVVPRIRFNGMGGLCIEAIVRIGHSACNVTGATTNQVVLGPGPTNNAIT